MTLLAIDDLSVDFGRHHRPALDHVSLLVDAGQRLGLVGASGSGKTVLASAVMGLLPDNAHLTGTVRFQGRDLTRLPDAAFSRLRGQDLTMVFQEPMTALDPTMKVGRQASEVRRLHTRCSAAQARAKVDEIFTRVGLDPVSQIADAYPHELSGGQRQRVVIAMAVMNNPSLVICDEPTTALDAMVQATVLALLVEELDRVDAACLFISHDLDVVSSMCDDVAVIHGGRIVETGGVDEVLDRPRHPYTQGLVATARIDAVGPGQRLPVIDDFSSTSDLVQAASEQCDTPAPTRQDR
ncbi:MAG: ABC transporter ATP-binding protein [Propionibacteriaceae bacterium]|nr:ABC transporter ATP-binding protein [Propionibacteriaceae bacterium]